MKNIFLILLLLSAFVACKRKPINVEPTNPIDLLPPYTEKGAETYGCLINGEVFIPRSDGSLGAFAARVDFSKWDTVYYLTIAAKNFYSKKVIALNGTLDSTDLIPKTFQLISYNDQNGLETGTFSGRYWIYSQNKHFTRPPVANGELNIKYFNRKKGIIAGTFWFDAIDTVTNDIIHITDGRFDLKY